MDLSKHGAEYFKPIEVSFRTVPPQRLFMQIVCSRVGVARVNDRVGASSGGFLRSFFSFALPRSSEYDQDAGTLYLGEKGFIFRGDQENLTLGFDDVMDCRAFRDGMKIDDVSGKIHKFRFERRISDDEIYEWNDMSGRLRDLHQDGDYIDENLNVVIKW